MIWEAELSDVPAALALGREFAEESGVAARTGWSDEDAGALLEYLIQDENGILFVSVDGMIGGYVAAHPFNRSTKMFVELFWRAKDGNGKALLRTAEERAKALGATKSIMVAMDNMERTRGIYSRLGYEPTEAQFMKELS